MSQGQFLIGVWETFSSFAGFFYPLWPVFVLTPIQRRRNILPLMLFGWAAGGMFGLVHLFAPYHAKSWLIPEPFNTALYWITGLALVGILVGRNYAHRRKLQLKADNATSAEDLRALSPTEFEDMIVEFYTALGHKAQRTGATGDHGIDVVVQSSGGEKWVVQCKRWRGQVGEPVVRDFYGAMHHEKADKGAIVTTGVFTPQARSWAAGKPISLVDGDEFLTLLKKARALAKKRNAT